MKEIGNNQIYLLLYKENNIFSCLNKTLIQLYISNREQIATIVKKSQICIIGWKKCRSFISNRINLLSTQVHKMIFTLRFSSI